VDNDGVSGARAPLAKGVLHFASRAEWRSWLESHHSLAAEARVAIYKNGARSADPQAQWPTLEDVQEEALCFGWIDTTASALDQSAYVIRLVPRHPNSEWSMTNVVRVERLATQGLMTDAGWRVVEEAKQNGQWDLALRVEQTDLVPPALEAALRPIPGALDAYLSLPHSRRKLMLRSVLSVKSAATIDRRIAAIVSEVSPS
jgi:uncharacterized protein YdeI (YjbR/CyaY-like superfamily)